MKILYEKFNDTQKKCETCAKFSMCKASAYAFIFDADYCNEYLYKVPYAIFETENREIIDKVIKVIEEYKDENHTLE